MDPSAPTVNFNMALPRGSKAPTRTLLFDVARGLARRVPLTKLVELDGDVRPYLASLMVAALHRAKDTLTVPDDLRIDFVTREQFENMLAKDAGKQYENYGKIAHNLIGNSLSAEDVEKEAEKRQRDRMEQLLGQVAKALPKLVGAGEGDFGEPERFGLGYS